VRRLTLLVTLGLCAAGLTGCGGWTIRAPKAWDLTYTKEPPPQPIEIALVDQRQTLSFDNGIQADEVRLDGKTVEPPVFLATYVSAALSARRLPLKLAPGSSGDPRLDLRTFVIQNHQANQWSVFWTSTLISADLVTPSGTRRLGVFVRRGSIGGRSEVVMSQPLEVAVNELASKLANQLYGYRAPDSEVQRLLAKLKGPRTDASWLDVYALGFTNNPLAIEPCAELTLDESEYVRLAAISSLGTLGAADRLPLLARIYANPENYSWQERAMALKSIGDLDTDASRAFIAKERPILASAPDSRTAWLAEVLDLYVATPDVPP